MQTNSGCHRYIGRSHMTIILPKILQHHLASSFQNSDIREEHYAASRTFISTDSDSFSRFTILMATFWPVMQCTPSFTSPFRETDKNIIHYIYITHINTCFHTLHMPDIQPYVANKYWKLISCNQARRSAPHTRLKLGQFISGLK